eukprot:s836_g13.t1
MADDDANNMKDKNEEIHALQEKSRGMIRLMSSMKPSRRLQVDRAPSIKLRGGDKATQGDEADSHSISAPEETQLQVKLLKAELHDQMELHRSELYSCKQSAQELSAHRTRSEACISKLAQQAAMESSLAEKNFNARLESEQRMWMEERRRMRSAHHRSLQSEKESMEQLRRQASEELASTNRRLEIEAREVREARSRQRAAEGKLKRSEQKQESHTSLIRGEAVEAEVHAERRQEVAALEASRLQASLVEAEHQVQRQQAMARLQNEMALKEHNSMTLELRAAVEEVKLGHVHEEELLKVLSSEEAYASRVHQDLGKTTSELKELSNAFQAAAAEHLHETDAAKEQAAVAEKAARVAAELRQKLERSSSEVQQLQLQHEQDMQTQETHETQLRIARQEVSEQHRVLHHQEASAKETRLQLKSAEAKLRSVEGSCAEAQMCFDSCYQELILAQHEAVEQKDLREQDLAQLRRACEESLEGLPLVFYEEVCKNFGGNEEQKASFTVPQYGHILEAVANCVHTLLRENTELQDAHRSISDDAMFDGVDHSATSSLGQLPPLSFTSLDDLRLSRSTLRSRDRRDRDTRDAPELHREVFVMHQELANFREEMRQLSVQKEIDRDMQEAKLCKARGDMSHLQLEMQEMQEAHLEELFVFQEELQKLRSKTAESTRSSSLQEKTPLEPEETSPFPRWRWQSSQRDAKPTTEDLSAFPAPHTNQSAAFRWPDMGRNAHLSDVSPITEEMQNTVCADSQYSFRNMDSGPSWAKAAREQERVESRGVLHSVEETNSGNSCKSSQAFEDLPSSQIEELPTFGSPETVPRRHTSHSNAVGDAAALKKAYSFAEALCDAQRYRDALPLLGKIIDVGLSKPHWLEAAGIRPADVWAYTGVAKQGESLTEESIKAYCEAIRLDPLLHVCHANLASLYSFQEDDAKARHHIAIALRLDPESQAYVELAKSLGFS